MISPTLLPPKPTIVYPDSDGQPMAENTLQFEYIVTIKGGLDALFRDAADVFIAGDLLWYPVEGEPTIRIAPDVLAAFGRPKGYRGSYKQWEEGGIAPQVTFEIMSPGNTWREMLRKYQFYERYGVEEYYVYEPENNELFGWIRQGPVLREIPSMENWVSPRLKVRFDTKSGKLELFDQEGRKFATYLELAAQEEQERRAREQAQKQAEHAQKQAEEQAGRAERLAAQLKALGIEPEA